MKYLVYLLFILCIFSRLSAETIKIGVSAPLTGPVADYGVWAKNGAVLAVEEINQQGGVNGKQIELIVEDDKCTPKDAVTSVTKLINLDKVDKFIVFCTSVASAVAPLTTKKAIVMTPSCKTKALYNPSYKHYFSLQPTMKREMKKLAEYLKENNYKKLAIITEENDFFDSYKTFLEETSKELAIEVVYSDSIIKTENDFRPQILKMISKKPDVLFASFSPSMRNAFYSQLLSQRFDKQLVANWAAENSLLHQVSKEISDGLVYTYHYNTHASEKSKSFAKKFEDLYQHSSEATAASSYDIIYLYKHLIETCDDKGQECMIKALSEVKDFDGASGNITFHERATTKEIYVKTYKDGEFKVIQ